MESNRVYPASKAPTPFERIQALSDPRLEQYDKMISVEPIMDFDMSLVTWFKQVPGLKFISVGADSKGHNLPEPEAGKLRMFVNELKEFTEVKIKDNLWRLMKK